MTTFFLSCSEGKDVSKDILGIWQTEWNAIPENFEIDEISVEEILVFQNDDKEGTGIFMQFMSGTISYDDWEDDAEIPYELNIEGEWHIKANNKVVLNYDLNTLFVNVTDTKIEGNYTESAIDLFSGNFGGAIVEAALETERAKAASKKINSIVSKEVEKYFRDMFIQIKKEKKALSNVMIDGDIMSCDINDGSLFGREQDYRRIKNHDLSVKQPRTDCQIDNTLELVGLIDGKYKINMRLDLMADRGSYYYLNTGSGANIDLVITDYDCESNQIKIEEYCNGNNTGIFDGHLHDDGSLSGFFINQKGKRLPFSLEPNNNP